MKTPDKILQNHRLHAERSDRGLAVAMQTANIDLVAFNTHQAFKAYFMMGLIGWRCGLEPPTAHFRQAVARLLEGTEYLKSKNALQQAQEAIGLERGAFVAFLVDIPFPSSLLKHSGFRADRLLSVLLIETVMGERAQDSLWSRAIDDLRGVDGGELAVQSYAAYRSLLHSSEGHRDELVKECEGLFSQRRKDTFFSGAEQTEGGGEDNLITTDYRLAAILKFLHLRTQIVHQWTWT